MYSLGPHLVWRLKYRRQVVGGRIACRRRELLGRIADEHGWQIVATDAIRDQRHPFARVGPAATPVQAVRAIAGGPEHVGRQVLCRPSNLRASVNHVSESTVHRYLDHPWDAVTS